MEAFINKCFHSRTANVTCHQKPEILLRTDKISPLGQLEALVQWIRWEPLGEDLIHWTSVNTWPGLWDPARHRDLIRWTGGGGGDIPLRILNVIVGLSSQLSFISIREDEIYFFGWKWEKWTPLVLWYKLGTLRRQNLVNINLSYTSMLL